MNFAKFHTRGGRGLQRAHPRIGLPLPPAGRRGARRHSTPAARGAATRGRRLPGHSLRGAATRRRAAYIGGAGVYRRAATSGALRGRTWRGGYRGGVYPAARAGYLYRGGVLGGAIPGAGYPAGGGRRRGGTATPRRSGYPGVVPGANMAISGAACDGYTPLGVSAAATGRGGLPGGGAEIFFRRGGYGGENPSGYPLRAYIRSPFFGRRGEDTF